MEYEVLKREYIRPCVVGYCLRPEGTLALSTPHEGEDENERGPQTTRRKNPFGSSGAGSRLWSDL